MKLSIVVFIFSYDDSLAIACKLLCQRLSEWNDKGCIEPMPITFDDLKTLSTAQIQEFLAQLLIRPPLSCETIKKMQELYSFDKIQNAEIKLRYAYLCLFISNEN